jgi:hypothetical protein
MGEKMNILMALTPVQLDQIHTIFGYLCILPIFGTIFSSAFYAIGVANPQEKKRISIYIPLFFIILLVIFCTITALCPALPIPNDPVLAKCVK